MESYFSRKLPIEGNYGTVWRGPWGAGTFTEAEACLRCCLVSRSRLKSQTGHQVSKGRDSLQHLGPFKGSEYGKSVSTGSKQVKLLLTPLSRLFLPQKCPSDDSACFLASLWARLIYFLSITLLYYCYDKRYTTLSLLFMSNQMWCQSNLHRDIISFNTSSLNSFWILIEIQFTFTVLEKYYCL